MELNVCGLAPLLWPGGPDGGLGSDAAALIVCDTVRLSCAHCARACIQRLVCRERAWLVAAYASAVTKSATVVGNVDGVRWVWRGAAVDAVVSRSSRGFVSVV